MGIYELPVVTNNKQKRLNESLQYKKYYIYKHLHANDEKKAHHYNIRKRTELRQFKKPLKSFKKKYIHHFDRPQNSYEEWYPKQIIEEHNIEENNTNQREETNENEEVIINTPKKNETIDLTFHKFNNWNHYSYVKELKKKNKSILLATTRKQHLEAYDKTFFKKTKKHYKTKHFLTDYSETGIIENNYKLLNISNVMQIWHMSIAHKNWKRAYKCMSIIIRIENIEIRQIYSLIIVTLQNYRSGEDIKVYDSEKDPLLNFLKWVTFKNSPLVRVNLNRTQTDKFAFFNRIKTFNSIPHVIYFYFYYNILMLYKKFMETFSKKDLLKFKQFLNSLEEMMLIPPFQDDFIFNYFLGLSYMILVDCNGILLETYGAGNEEDILREANLNLNKSVKIFKQLGISAETNDSINSFDVYRSKKYNHNKKYTGKYYFNKTFILEQLSFLKHKIFGRGSDSESNTSSTSSENETSEIYNNSLNAMEDDDELMRQESLMFENLNDINSQQKSDGHQYWMD